MADPHPLDSSHPKDSVRFADSPVRFTDPEAASISSSHTDHEAPMAEVHGHGDTRDAAGHGGLEHIHEVPSFFTLLRNGPLIDNPSAKHTLHLVENTFFSLIVVLVIGLIVRRATRRMTLVPGKLQNLVEMLIEAFDKFVRGIMGDEHGRRYLPFVGSLFFFILFNNLMGLVPFCKAPTSAFQTTLALGLCTFGYVQWHALRMNGPWGYLHHLMGSPRGVVMWIFAPFLFLLHVLGELIKPVSLSLRLFGNIMGEDILLYVFSFLGMSLIFWGFPLQLPFFFLSLLLGTIQALVFSLLATIYITLFIPHEHGEH